MTTPHKSPRRLTRRERAERRRLVWLAEHPFYPFEGYEPEGFADRVHRAMGGRKIPTWTKGKNDRTRPLTLADLAVGLWAVSCTDGDPRGLSYARLSKAFKSASDGRQGCHLNKAAAVLAALKSYGLIALVGRHSKGRKGNQYHELAEGEIASPLPPPMPRPAPFTDERAFFCDDDPWF